MLNYQSPWHKESFDNFLNNTLPQLLAERLPLTSYSVSEQDVNYCHIRIGLSGDVELGYTIPQPDQEGLFHIHDHPQVVLPIASDEHLGTANITCVGEQLLDYIDERLGTTPKGIKLDQIIAQALLPLGSWVDEFLRDNAQWLHDQNWLAIFTHIRRLLIPTAREAITPAHFGRTCLIETPEGPNIGKVITIATGAQIVEGRLIITDDSPRASLGLSASCIPFLEHSDPNRLLMGANMMRQWFAPDDPEPAYVQTGLEPDAQGFWCGRNVLTAFVSWGADVFEDGILMSESCAKRFNYPTPTEPGDKFSNRHGTKGVVSRVVPDDEMPHLAGGTPVEIVFSSVGLHARLNFGQALEAVASRIARHEGTAFIAEPFKSPSAEQMRDVMQQAGLPEDGMDCLHIGRDCPNLEMPSLVGWIYWGKTEHQAAGKLCPDRMLQGEREYAALREVGAVENIREYFNTRTVEHSDSSSLRERAASGPRITQAEPPSVLYDKLQTRINACGVKVELSDKGLSFQLVEPDEPRITLAEPVKHPWLPSRKLTTLGVVEKSQRYLWGAPEDSVSLAPLQSANNALLRLLESKAPEALRAKARTALAGAAEDYLEEVVSHNEIRFYARQMFSNKAVLTPGVGLSHDQVGLGDELAWQLFGPLVTREFGDSAEVENRTQRAADILDDIMARSWVLIDRAPTMIPTGIIAFHPVRTQDNTIGLHPCVCRLMNADYDGDQAAVILPITEAAQREAGEKLSVAGQVRHNPELIRDLLPSHDVTWGLAYLSLSPDGRKQIEEALGRDLVTQCEYVTRNELGDALAVILGEQGVEAALDSLQRLVDLGFDAAKKSGASLSPFAGERLNDVSRPDSDDPREWELYSERITDYLASATDYTNPDLGPQILAAKSGARGSLSHISSLAGAVRDAEVMSYTRGLTYQQMCDRTTTARKAMARIADECAAMHVGYGNQMTSFGGGFHVLARAMRADHPGVVFARAAMTGEVDPLTDPDSRAFVGLPT